MTNPKSPDESHHLAVVKDYVERNSDTIEMLNRVEWDLLEDLETEQVLFRLKDKSTPETKGVAVGVDMDDLRVLEEHQLVHSVGNLFLNHLAAGLPRKEPGKPYTLEVVRTY
ncbi:hypothetical protein [Deinococcus sp. Leaf326]|uniref:hypothetical protein n=1 Tax=Deinococcus sp. Leaf326 TaxID=1736338 RepID=UPI0006F56E23|nr:hypothetical protein [Deinococcus sp. Leaf326]KQR40765.1 hypothetical protein ASF71_00935 [Deinococcus sp. Leaf326]